MVIDCRELHIEVDRYGVWNAHYKDRYLFENCSVKIEIEGSDPNQSLVFDRSYSKPGADVLGKFTGIASEFTLGEDIVLTRAINIYEETGAFAVFVSVHNISEKKEISLRKMTVVDGTLCITSQGTKILVNDWERYNGNNSLKELDCEKSLFSAWNVELYCKEQVISLVSGILSGKEMFTSFELGQNTSGLVRFNASGDVASGSDGVLLLPGSMLLSDGILMVPDESPYKAAERYSMAVSKYNRIEMRHKNMTGWADWYFYYGMNSEKTVLENLDAIDSRLKGYGIEYIQVDDGWQKIKEFVRYESLDLTCTASSGAPWEENADFKSGMKQLADRIHEKGYKAGLWIRPFSIMNIAKEYVDGLPWVLKHAAEEEMPNRATVDISREEALEWLGGLFYKLTGMWGYDYIKYDFITYDILRNGNFNLNRNEVGSFKIRNREITSSRAYYNALKAFREGAGRDTFLLGCNCLAGNAIGLVDGYRISGDVCIFNWELTKNMLISSAYRYHMNGVIWQNDPDVLMVGEKLSLDKAIFWASFVGLAGGMILFGDCIPILSEERIDIIKRILPGYGGRAKPIRLFEDAWPSVWNLPVKKEFGKWNIVGLFNWGNEGKEVYFRLDELELDNSKKYGFFDFWKEEYLGEYTEGFSSELEGNTCKVLSIRELKTVPQVISTGYHIVQGGNELLDEFWDSGKRILNIRTHGIRGSSFKLYVRIPDDYRTVGVDILNNKEMTLKNKKEILSVEFTVGQDGLNEIAVRFDV